MKREKPNFDRSAILLVDLQKVYMAGELFETKNWDQIIANAKKLIDCCREEKIPVIFIRMWYRSDGSDALPCFPRDKEGKPLYAVAGTEEADIVDELKPGERDIIINKQRMSGFFQTNLDLTLHALEVNHLIVTGVSTNACVLTTVHDGYFRGYKITVVKDACGCENRAAHITSILNMANWVYGCSIFATDELIKAIKGQTHHSWHWDRPGDYLYTLETVEKMYDQI